MPVHCAPVPVGVAEELIFVETAAEDEVCLTEVELLVTALEDEVELLRYPSAR